MDLSFFSTINDPFTGMVALFMHGGWIIYALVSVEMIRILWLEWRRGIWEKKIKYVLLAIDIPKENEQSPKAVESFFDHLQGMDKTPTQQERYIDGFTPTRISFELVSIGGYVQFLIRTPEKMRDLVEAALYAQYPDAELTEVEDYIDGVPKPDEWAKHWPNMKMNMWGAEIALGRPSAYPIKTWMEFEHSMSQELKDPMGGILEILSRMRPDEQVWIQWVVQTAGVDWLKDVKKEVKRLIGAPLPQSAGLGIGAVIRNVVQGVQESVTASLIDPSAFASDPANKKAELPSKMLYLSPGERTIVEAIERKTSKPAFKVRGRLIYFGNKETFSKARGISGVYGAIKQFNTGNLNYLAPPSKSKTEAWYFLTRYRTRQRMRMLLAGYRARSTWRGFNLSIFNSEELATLWHFPVQTVKAQLIQKTESKKGFAPTALPVEIQQPVDQQPVVQKPVAKPTPATQEVKNEAPPANLPFV